MTLQKKFFLMAVAVLITAIVIVGFMTVVVVHIGGDDDLLGYMRYRRAVLHTFRSLSQKSDIDFSRIGEEPVGFNFLVSGGAGEVLYASFNHPPDFTLGDPVREQDTELEPEIERQAEQEQPPPQKLFPLKPYHKDISRYISFLQERQLIIETAINADAGYTLIMQYSKDADMVESYWNPLKGLFVFVLVFLGISGAGSLVIERTGRSIRVLSTAAERIADGDMDFDIPGGDRSDEIASLRDSFETMRSSLKEESAKRARFLMAVSHDLKTPLTSIEGYVEAIKDGLARKPEELQKYLGIISAKAGVLEERILELIDFVNMETGEWKLKSKSFELDAFLDELSQDWQSEAEVLNRRFFYRSTITGGYTVIGDPKLLKRVFENLFDNAVRYSAEGGCICLTCTMQPEGGCEVVVSDDGSGIPHGMEEQVFEPFYRGTRSRREQGFGLGLSIVRSIVVAHGWTIRIVRNTKGATLLISIPPSATA